MSPERLFHILLSPQDSEKATRNADENNQHTFRVVRDASKAEVRAAVEKLFEVEVDSVRLMNVKGKTKRFGRTLGKRADWKKAIVRLKPGHDINIAGTEA